MAEKFRWGGGRARRKIIGHIFEKIISLENLFLAWQEFKRGKINKKEVSDFNFTLEDNIFQIRQELISGIYCPGRYSSFYVCDPKRRFISKAGVKDRLIHQAIFRVLYNIFDQKFIADSYSCRFKKGTSGGVKKLEKFTRQISRNYYYNIYALKADVKKFFASVDKKILFDLIRKKVNDPKALWLIKLVINSFQVDSAKGLPLGNVTSQLFANIYLNELDQFIKKRLKVRYYLRYCDDFIILDRRKDYLLNLIEPVSNFLEEELELQLHPQKIIITKLSRGLDFLGYLILPHYKIIRTSTKKRILRKFIEKQSHFNKGLITKESLNQSKQSYLGILRPVKSYNLAKKLFKDQF